MVHICLNIHEKSSKNIEIVYEIFILPTDIIDSA